MSISSATGSIKIEGLASLVQAITGQANARRDITVGEAITYANGEVAGKINLAAYVYASGIAASSNTDYDLRAITDSTGLQGELEFANISAIVVQNLRTTALAWLKVGPKDGTNGFGILGSPTANIGLFNAGTDRVVVPPGGCVVLASTQLIPTSVAYKDLRITCSGVTGDTNSWKMLILGQSA